MRSDTIDLAGNVFGYLTAIKIASDKPTKWLCRCECGNLTIVKANILSAGKSKSCGCKTKELASKQLTTHGMSGSVEYNAYYSMIRRCTDSSHRSFKDYGGRGIKVCDRWTESFEFFYADMGDRPKGDYSVERIDNDKGYSPENCKWATRKEQSRNTRRNHLLTHNGVTKHLTDWAERIGITQQALQGRLNKMPMERALSMPPNRDMKRYIESNGKKLTIDGWAKELGLDRTTIFRRLNKYPVDKALGIGFRGIKVSGEKSVVQLNKDGEFVAEFKSISEAGRQTGIDFRLISSVLNGKQKTTGGYRWECTCKT